MTFRAGATASALLVISILLVGCTAPISPVPDATTAAPVAEATRAPAATPTPSATPTAAVVDELVLRPTFVELHSAGQVVQQLDYLSPSADAIARFTELFGREPEVTEYAPTNHYAGGERYKWGMVTLQVEDLTDGRHTFGHTLLNPEFTLFFDGPSEGTVGLRAGNGARAGDSYDTLPSVAPADGFTSCDGLVMERVSADTPDGFGGALVVARPPWNGETTVGWLRAPSVEGTGCA